MKSPNAIPNSPIPMTPKFVGAGLQRLPGASALERPSMKITAMRNTVDIIPSIEVYERTERGQKTVGMRLYENKVAISISISGEKGKRVGRT